MVLLLKFSFPLKELVLKIVVVVLEIETTLEAIVPLMMGT
jgi:hypothetical protein